MIKIEFIIYFNKELNNEEILTIKDLLYNNFDRYNNGFRCWNNNEDNIISSKLEFDNDELEANKSKIISLLDKEEYIEEIEIINISQNEIKKVNKNSNEFKQVKTAKINKVINPVKETPSFKNLSTQKQQETFFNLLKAKSTYCFANNINADNILYHDNEIFVTTVHGHKNKIIATIWAVNTKDYYKPGKNINQSLVILPYFTFSPKSFDKNYDNLIDLANLVKYAHDNNIAFYDEIGGFNFKMINLETKQSIEISADIFKTNTGKVKLLNKKINKLLTEVPKIDKKKNNKPKALLPSQNEVYKSKAQDKLAKNHIKALLEDNNMDSEKMAEHIIKFIETKEKVN